MYQELVEGLSKLSCGLTIDKHSFNVFCYADDLLLTGVTATILQKLINYANACVTGMDYRLTQISPTV